jgi:hypothetical protein
MPILALLLVVVVAFVAAPLHAQTVHLAPLPEATFDRQAVLLWIGHRSDTAATNLLGVSNPQVRIADGRMYVSHRDSGTVTIQLGDRTIAEFIEHLRARFPKAKFSSNFLELSTRYLREGDAVVDTVKRGHVIGGRESAPIVRGLLGVGLSLNETQRDASTNRLLQNAGLHLDIVGSKQFRSLNLRTRLGFRSGEAVTTTQKDSTAAPGTGPTSVTGLVETAERVSIGFHADHNGPRITNDMLLGFGIEAATTYSALPAFQFADVPVGEARRPVEDVFDAAEIARARAILDQVIPSWTFLAGPRLVFGHRESQVFYAQFDGGWTQHTVRTHGVRYRVEEQPGGQPPVRTPVNLLARIETANVGIWRIGAGGTLAGIVELRADATGPFRADPRMETKPLLRVMVGSNLALAR